jgi:ABC-type bacteriocin/lantibiotic exporter with double-glycine peptidase domain
MQKYNLIPQEKDDYCLCSVLQAILDNNGIKISQDEIAENLDSSKKRYNKKGYSNDSENIKKFLDKNGFEYKYYWRYKVPFNEIDFALDGMKETEGFISMNSHAYLFVDYNGFEVSLINPNDGQLEKYITPDLDNKMRESGIMGFFGMITKLK